MYHYQVGIMQYSEHNLAKCATIVRRIKRFPSKTFTNVGMVQRVSKNRVRAPTHHTGNKSPDTRRGSLASLAIHNPCRSQFIAFKRLCIHCTQVNILRLQVTLARDPLLVSGLLLPVWCVGARTRFLLTRCTIPTFVNVFEGNLFIRLVSKVFMNCKLYMGMLNVYRSSCRHTGT